MPAPSLSFALNGAAPAGLVVNANGTYSFNPANAAYQSLAVGQSQVITVPYTVTDNAGATSTANLVITVTGTNDAPVAQAAAFSVAEDAAIVNGTVTATDVDAGATRTFALNGAAPAGLDVQQQTAATASTRPTPPTSRSASASRPSSRCPTRSPTTAAPPRRPTSSSPSPAPTTHRSPVADSGALAENATLTATAATGVLANDTDVDAATRAASRRSPSAPPAARVGTGLNGTYGTLTLNADGSYSYVANRPAAEALTAGQVVTESFTLHGARHRRRHLDGDDHLHDHRHATTRRPSPARWPAAVREDTTLVHRRHADRRRSRMPASRASSRRAARRHLRQLRDQRRRRLDLHAEQRRRQRAGARRPAARRPSSFTVTTADGTHAHRHRHRQRHATTRRSRSRAASRSPRMRPWSTARSPRPTSTPAPR